MNSIKISFETKFCQSHLDDIIANYWDKTFVITNTVIVFDLTITEWISSEEITFLFAWIRKLNLIGKKIEVHLPFPYAKYIDEDKSIIKRRRDRNFYLLAVWGMLNKIGLTDLNFKNIVDNYNSLIEKNQFFNFGKKIIPFRIIDTSWKKDEKVSVDIEYEKFITGSRVIEVSTDDYDSKQVFNLEADLINLLNDNHCYSPFESKILSHVITKELLINSIEHSKQDESYFTTSLNDKWATPNTEYFIQHFTLEKEPSTLDFYRDKELIAKEITKEISGFSLTQKKKIGDKYRPKLAKYDNFKNQSYLEFTFLDFGEGVFSTLKKQFKERLANKELNPLSNFLSKNVFTKHEDSQILEYAFLMESSKDPFDREIEYSELIPRGLYFLIDMVRRYKGLLIARSGFGKVVYDFSDRIQIRKTSTDKFKVEKERIYIAKDSVVEDVKELSFLQGTMVSIVLPQRTTENLKKSAVRIDDLKLNNYIFNRNIADDDLFPKKIFEPEFYEYLSLAFLHQDAYVKLSIQEINKKNGVESFIFKKIDKKLDELLGKNCVLFIDFEFLPDRNYMQIISYLANTPKVNEFTKVIFVNLHQDEHKVIREFKQKFINYSNESDVPFLFKPIPCLTFNKPHNQEPSIKNINWIGIRKKEDEIWLTKIFFGKISTINIDNIEDKWICEGNVISIYDDFVYSVFKDFNDLMVKFTEAKLKFTENWLITTIEDGTKPKAGKLPYVFLTSKGSYQQQYISLYETLHFKYLANYFAKLLLDIYIENSIKHFNEKNETKFYDLNESLKSDFLETLRFDKLIVVTVSSQLIGVAIRNLIKNNDDYEFLRNKKYQEINQKWQHENEGKTLKARIKDCPEIIRLSSYFTFDTEKPFENIEKGNEIIIVNDVISTGSLIQRLIDGIIFKKAKISAVLTIADCRDKNADLSKEHQSIFFTADIENTLVSIVSSLKNSDFVLKKQILKPKGIFDIKRINPILNAVVELKSEHSEKTRILFEKPEDILSTSIFQNNIFQIGHFKQNLSHNAYFTDMGRLFYEENGKALLMKLKEKIELDPRSLMVTDYDMIKNNLNNATNSIKSLLTFKYLALNNPKLNAITTSIEDLLKDIDNERLDNTSNSISYKPDFIFHPVFSGIEEVTDETFHEVFGTNLDNIISLQRYETKNGWRFPFPAKRFNKITQGQHILIIDSGALSGHSLVQLVDSISFLEVGRIDVLTIISRIDDFQREFYSRLKSIKVKNLKNNNESDKRETNVNLNLLFGINLNIPPYISEDVCPYCKEIKLLDSYLKNFETKLLPNETKEYIKERKLNEIMFIKDPSKSIFPTYIPVLKDTKLPDYPNLFLMRDKLGKIDSYRFYHDYFPEFDEMCDDASEIGIFNNPKELKSFEQILICLLHEPFLYGILKDLLVNVHYIAKNIIKEIVFDQSHKKEELFYEWTNYSLIRLAYLFNSDNVLDINYIYKPDSFEALFDFVQDNEQGLNYLSFLIAEEYYNLKEKSKEKVNMESILEHLLLKIGDNDTKARRIVHSFTREYKKTKIETVNDALSNLKKFFVKESSLKVHSTLENCFSKIDDGINNLKFIEQKKDNILSAITYIIPILQEWIFQNLEKLKSDEKINKCYELQYPKLFGTKQIYEKMCEIFEAYNQLIDMDKTNVAFENKLVTLSKDLSNFQTDFLFIGEKNYFATFCIKYRTNLKECLNPIIDKFNTENPPNLKIEANLNNFSQTVNAHFDFLDTAITEIFQNAKTFANKNPDKDIEIKVTCVKNKNNEILLTFEQNQEFYNPLNIKRGTEEIIRTVFELFCGVDGFSTQEKPNYKLVAIFK
ncbi:MAG: hypothetical protein KGZ62_01645 [Sulfurimonas sp.]|nr:hypothetical protein [Sulfurimonas sp.]